MALLDASGFLSDEARAQAPAAGARGLLRTENIRGELLAVVDRALHG
jgi:hypothetical protein